VPYGLGNEPVASLCQNDRCKARYVITLRGERLPDPAGRFSEMGCTLGVRGNTIEMGCALV
jgi:hypothetical protein